MKQLVEYIVSNIVNHPEEVVVEESMDGELTKVLIAVNPEDVGRVIGKSGKVIKAIRQIARIAAIQKGLKVIVDLKNDSISNETPEMVPAEETVSTEDVVVE